jgi:tetratricopeptide (TPR) repeat protein
MILQHYLNIQHSKGDKLVKSILITGLLLCLAVSTLHAKGQAQSQVDEAAILFAQATQYLDQGRYDEAEPLYQRVLAIIEKALGPDHPDTASSLNNLALIYHAQRKYAEAEHLTKRALATRASITWRSCIESRVSTWRPNFSINALSLSERRHWDRTIRVSPLASTTWCQPTRSFV